ncbi:MFS transporter [Kutzneria buriramensis]|uniref:Putative MFS family arabinose efflux permease n=1 Tax=Kutzneria buriramensis TaxID=1045776 RepID=A0A3E0I5E2_9PSEU|nr:MFS transporter [Kutzneria buriramensis]REH53811.1 putative MFS family arabinose efflux permease [Kutzneria buriramensis]
MSVLVRAGGLRLVLPIVLGTLLNAVNSSMIAVALVDIQHEFHAGAEVVWLVSGLYLATAVAQPTMGRLADRFGARRVFCWGLVIVMAAAVGAPFAPTLGWLVAARVLLGVGTSAAYPSGVSLIRQGIGGEATGALGAISAAGQVAVALGPPLGGLLVLLAGWRSIFWVNLPLAAASLVLVLLWVPRDRAPRSTSAGLDPLGILLFAAAMVGLLVFLLDFRWLFLGSSVVLAIFLLWWELRVPQPFLDVRMLWSNRPLSRTYGRVAVTYVVFYTVFYGVPQWLEQGRQLSSAVAGLVVLPIAGMGIVATVIATRRSGWPLLVIGSAGLLVGSLVLLFVGASTPLLLLVIVSAVLGIPNGFNSLGNQTAMYAAAPDGQVGTASGLYRTSQYVGANLAATLVGLGLGDHATDGGLHLLAAIISVISAGLLAAAVFRLRHK